VARIAGTSGTLSFGAAILALTDWNINTVGDMPDATGMDSTIDEYVRGLSSWTASCNGHWNTVTPPDPATDILATTTELVTISDGVNTYTGQAFMTRCEYTASIDGLVDFSLDFQGTGGFDT